MFSSDAEGIRSLRLPGVIPKRLQIVLNLPEVFKIDHSSHLAFAHYLLHHEEEAQPKTDTRYPLSDLWCEARREM